MNSLDLKYDKVLQKSIMDDHIHFLDRVINCIIEYKEYHGIPKETLISVSTSFKSLCDLNLKYDKVINKLSGLSELIFKDSSICPHHFLAHIVKKIGLDDAGIIIVNCGPYEDE